MKYTPASNSMRRQNRISVGVYLKAFFIGDKMPKYIENVWLSSVTCCECGMLFAMSDDFKNKRLEDHKSFYCPAGHAQHFTGKSDSEKLRDELDQKTQQLQREKLRSNEIERQRDQVRKTYHRMRERLKNGVCLCCNRTFQNLVNHIKTKHPDFANHETLKIIRTTYGLSQTALSKEIGVQTSYISNYEGNKYLPEHAKKQIEIWIDTQDERVS